VAFLGELIIKYSILESSEWTLSNSYISNELANLANIQLNKLNILHSLVSSFSLPNLLDIVHKLNNFLLYTVAVIFVFSVIFFTILSMNEPPRYFYDGRYTTGTPRKIYVERDNNPLWKILEKAEIQMSYMGHYKSIPLYSPFWVQYIHLQANLSETEKQLLYDRKNVLGYNAHTSTYHPLELAEKFTNNELLVAKEIFITDILRVIAQDKVKRISNIDNIINK
jgi:hypothetical protein